MNFPNKPQSVTISFAFSTLNRCIKEIVGKNNFSKEVQREIMDFFYPNSTDIQCVYCDSSDVKRWDHLVPVKDNGEMCIGNVVPACPVCDDSKGDRNFEKWILSKALKSPKSRGVSNLSNRINKLKEYQNRFNYKPIPLEKKLTNQGQALLKNIQKSLNSLKLKFEKLQKCKKYR